MQPGGAPAGRAPSSDPREAAAGEAGLRGIFESGFDALLVLDGASRVREANAAARALLDQPRVRLLDVPLADLVAPSARPAMNDFWTTLLVKGDAVATGVVVDSSGGLRALHWRGRASVAPDVHLVQLRAEPEGVVPEPRVDEMRARLAESEKLAALGTLVLGVAHEVRTPLTFVANNLFLLQKQLENAIEEGAAKPALLASARPHMRDALAGVDRINQLVLELRRFTQRRSNVRTTVGLEAAVAGAIELFRATNRSRARLDVRLTQTPLVDMDIAQVQQVVINLLDNAADAMPLGGEVTIETAPCGAGAVLVVSDRGVGIPPENRDRILQGFFTTKAHGTGLGLSIVRRIVAQHGGGMEIDSEPGKGTRVRVTFPASRASSPNRGPGSG